MDATVNFAAEQARRLQNAEMLGDRRQGDVERFGKFGDGGFAVCEAGDNGATCGIGKRAKGGIEQRAGIVNHTV